MRTGNTHVHVSDNTVQEKSRKSYLLSNFWFGSEFQKTASKRRSCLEVFELEEEIQCSSESENHVNWLHVAVREVCRHLRAHTFLGISSSSSRTVQCETQSNVSVLLRYTATI